MKHGHERGATETDDVTTDYDVITIGGGPAGSTAAALTAAAGRKTLLLDRESFPRFRIGESLMPATYWTFKRLGMLDRMRASRFVQKRSVQFFSGTGKGSAPFYFHEFDDHESSQTWQVVRSEFDAMLLKNAGEKGAEVRQQANVRDVLMEGNRATGVEVEHANGRRETLTCRVLIDASGQSSILSRRFKLKRDDPKLQHMAYFTRYRGARREPGIDEGATLVLQTQEGRTWFWYIPLPDDEVSVGTVGPQSWFKELGDTPLEVFLADSRRCPALLERIDGAERIVDVSVLRDFSYISRCIAGDGWILAGDAFGFLDPIYSTGVFLALKSGEYAADAAIEALESGDTSAAQLGKHGPEYVAGMEAMRKLVYAYYAEDFHIGEFVKRHPDCRRHIVNLLVGNVFRTGAGDLFDKMERYVELPEARTLAPLEQVG